MIGRTRRRKLPVPSEERCYLCARINHEKKGKEDRSPVPSKKKLYTRPGIPISNRLREVFPDFPITGIPEPVPASKSDPVLYSERLPEITFLPSGSSKLFQISREIRIFGGEKKCREKESKRTLYPSNSVIIAPILARSLFHSSIYCDKNLGPL